MKRYGAISAVVVFKFGGEGVYRSRSVGINVWASTCSSSWRKVWPNLKAFNIIN
jgi:hypothetical protein